MGEETQESSATLEPSHPLLPRAVALHRDGSFDSAAKLYREILREFPQHFDATHLLGVVAIQQEQFGTAQHLIHAALDINPHDTSAMANLGTSYMSVGQLEYALLWFRLAVRMDPDSQLANTNVGTALHHLGRHRDAIPALRNAYRADPHSSAVRILLGACLIAIGEAHEAADLFEAADETGPHDAESTAQFEKDCVARAIESRRQIRAIASPSAQMLAAYANVLLSNGLHDEAIEQFERAVALDGSRLDFRWTMAIARLKIIYMSGAEIEGSRRAFAKSLDEVETWSRCRQETGEPYRAVGMNQPFYIAYQPFQNRELLRRYGALCTSWMATLPADLFDGHGRLGAGADARAHRRLRIGIVSSHIHEHSVWNAITKGWVYNIDRSRFEIHIFKLDTTSDRETENARGAVDQVHDQPKNLSEWIRAIRNQDLDVLIYPEIGMHPLTLQLACLRLTPVQVAFWGHPETTGLPTIDLYISADACEPLNASENYVEELVRLPNLGVYVETLAPAISKPDLVSLNLPGNEPLLLCAGSPFKYSPLYDEVWVNIAKHLEKRFFKRSNGGRLVFFRSGNVIVDRMLESRLRAAFIKGHVEFDERVSIVPKLPRSQFFGLMRESALMLDTPGFSGFNTALQAIECELPVLAFESEFMRGRLASGIMRRLDLPELVATTTEEFVQKALDLAGNAGRRKRLRAKITERRNMLFRDTAPVLALERCLTDAVAKRRAQPN